MSAAGLADRLKSLPQHLLPQQALTALAHRISNSALLARPMIAAFRRLFDVTLDEYQVPTEGFATFDRFFTRRLRPGARGWPEADGVIASPCDGRLSQLGAVCHGSLVQAKGRKFRLADLLADESLAERLAGGRFATIYLAPSDYHRVHMPLNGTLVAQTRVPGRLFSVSDATARTVDRLYARNERLVAEFDTDHGPMAVVMVAALLVAGIETAWNPDGPTRPGRQVNRSRVDPSLPMHRGDEFGTFHWGSTVIVILPERAPAWRDDLAPGVRLVLGQPLSREPEPRLESQ